MPYPKPESERRNRTKPAFNWTPLPREGRSGPAPKLPNWRAWDRRTKKWWTELWKKPQATQWEQDGSTLFPLAVVMDDLITARIDSVRATPEIRQLEDRHGLNPKALLQLRWMVMDEEEPVPVEEPDDLGDYGHLRAVKDEAG